MLKWEKIFVPKDAAERKLYRAIINSTAKHTDSDIDIAYKTNCFVMNCNAIMTVWDSKVATEYLI